MRESVPRSVLSYVCASVLVVGCGASSDNVEMPGSSGASGELSATGGSAGSGGAIGFNFGISLGVAFRPWGWGYNRFDWGSRAVFINNARWGRTWVNRGAYVHPYAADLRRYAPAVRPGPMVRHAATWSPSSSSGSTAEIIPADRSGVALF